MAKKKGTSKVLERKGVTTKEKGKMVLARFKKTERKNPQTEGSGKRRPRGGGRRGIKGETRVWVRVREEQKKRKETQVIHRSDKTKENQIFTHEKPNKRLKAQTICNVVVWQTESRWPERGTPEETQETRYTQTQELSFSLTATLNSHFCNLLLFF